MAAPPLLGASSKTKKDDKTYIFELQIGESNEETYPEYSWKDLVAADQARDRLASSGKTLLDPYASDDEDNLKAMAAKFEKKYKSSHSSKRKRRAEDYIDRGAGYDETDSFIDNSDVYDEVVPADLETVKGGFYINSGSLDFKEVELSEEEDEEESSIVHEDRADAAVTTTTAAITTKENGKSSNENHNGGNKASGDKVVRPSLLVSKKGSASLSSKTKSEHHNIIKSKGNGSGSNKSVVPSVTKIITNQIEDAPPKKVSSENESSSSGSSSSESSSSDGSSTSSSDSSSSGEDDDLTDFKEEKPKKQMSKDLKKLVPPQRTTPMMVTTTASSLTSSEHPPPVKRLKTKNVPPNPNLPKNKLLTKASPGLVNVSSSKDSMIVTSTCSPSPKLISRPMPNVTPITSVSNLGLTISHGMTASNIKVPTPKTTPTSHSTQNNATNLMGLNLVKQHGSSSSASSSSIGVPKQKSLKTKINLPSSLLTDQGLIQNTLNLVNSAFAAQSSVPGRTPKKKPKVAKMTANSTRNSLSSKQQQQQRPPKLKARPRLKHGVPLNLPSSTIQNASNLSQSLPSFSRPSQQPSLASQRVEITKIKPHSNSSPSTHHHQLSSSIKSLSSLGTGIFPVTVTEVKEKVAGTSSSATFGGTTSSPRSRSPNVGGTSVGSHSNNNNASRLPQSLTITPSPLLNISSSSGPTCSTAGMNLSNIMSPIPISRGNSLLFGQQQQQQLTTTSGGFSMNTILGKEYPSLNSSTTLSSKDFFADQNLLATMAYNINLSRETHKK